MNKFFEKVMIIMFQTLIQQQMEMISDQVINWRRDLHRHPEVGWTEFRTTALIAEVLLDIGFSIKLGKEIIHADSRMGVPDTVVISEAKDRALNLGANKMLVEKMGHGLTGVVGEWKSNRPGPTVAFRFDIDALNIYEDNSIDHVPFKDNFASINEGVMHACGHDGHAAIGLGVASLISGMKDHFSGKVKLIFQPAEEGCRGAKAMIDAGILDDVDYLFTGHLGLNANRNNLVVCGVTNFMASSKIDVDLVGVPAHASFAPQEGHNALLAASTMALQLHAISRHGKGDSRINVGMLQSGTGRNIIPAMAMLQLETRGTSNEVNEYLKQEAIRIIRSVSQMYQVTERIELIGEAISTPCNDDLVTYIEKVVHVMNPETEVIRTLPFNASEDATYMMEAVQRNGGKATYMLFGTELKAGHHHHAFDFNEEALKLAVEVYGNILFDLVNSDGQL
ncbi:amidohydrolase [Brevibacillus sp. NRS-1366]|uniref:amidohydrolase n=1 Tax=Brevibacillus sp. NRS-1366 TaxID=3233899 RepID=UPI003D1C1E8D